MVKTTTTRKRTTIPSQRKVAVKTKVNRANPAATANARGLHAAIRPQPEGCDGQGKNSLIGSNTQKKRPRHHHKQMETGMGVSIYDLLKSCAVRTVGAGWKKVQPWDSISNWKCKPTRTLAKSFSLFAKPSIELSILCLNVPTSSEDPSNTIPHWFT